MSSTESATATEMVAEISIRRSILLTPALRDTERAMSEENVEIVRTIYADWGRGDFTSADWADPKIEMIIADGLSPGRSAGMGEVTRTWRDVLSVWKDFRAEAEAFRQLDDGRVLVLLRNTGRGKASGVELEDVTTRGANVWTIVDGKATRLVAYWDRDKAFADLGLQE